MYVYLARGNRDAGNQFISIKKAYERPTGVHPHFSQWGSWLPILKPQDKPVPMLLDLGDVELPGWLCYTCDGFMELRLTTIQIVKRDPNTYERCTHHWNIKIPILKPGQCKRLSIKI